MPLALAPPELKSFVIELILQLSDAVTSGTVTLALHSPGVVLTVMSPGQLIIGSSSSVTVTVCVLHDDELPAASVAVHVMVVIPTGNAYPGGIPVATIVAPQASKNIG